MPSTPTDRPIAESNSSAISNAALRVLGEYTGRRSTAVRTHFNDDLITVVLRDTVTEEERAIVGNGGSHLVPVTRKAFQNAMKRDLIAAVERLSGRSVIAFMSENHIDPDIAIGSFVLAPQAERAFPSSDRREGADTSNALSQFSRGLPDASQLQAHDDVKLRWMVALPFALCSLFIAGFAFLALTLLVLAEAGVVMAVITDLVAVNLVAVVLGAIVHQRRGRQANHGGGTRTQPPRRKVLNSRSPHRSHTPVSP